ncbi:hypothetical protein LEN26_001298 [Aphanomyces euteiches]|nr:hypothetical protein LEN26_001298 [Aphanomyces euteiches]
MRWEDTKQILSTSVPPLKNHTATLVKSRIFVFGGYDGRRNHNDLHVFDCDTLSWETFSESPRHGLQLNDDSTATRRQRYLQGSTFPAGRNGHTATLADNRIYILGGWLGSGPLAADDLHILHVDSMLWEQPVTTGQGPGPCNMHTADFLPHARSIAVFRGGDGKEYLNDLHLFNVDNHHWTSPSTDGTPPMPRANHSSALLDHRMYIFGGWNGTRRLNDIHILDTSPSCRPWRWSSVQFAGQVPHPRAGMSFVCLRQRFFLFGGYGISANTYPAKCFNDLYVLDPHDGHTWREIPSRSSINGNSSQSAPYEANPNDTSSFDSPLWIESSSLSPSSSLSNSLSPELQLSVVGCNPSRRAGHTCTVVNRKLFIFGGSFDNEYLNDMHILDTDPTPEAAITTSCNLTAALAKYVDSPDYSDISFVVEDRVVHAHKLVLSLASDRFRAMFSHGFREASAAQIVIPDMTHEVFRAIMEYIYAGGVLADINVRSVAMLLELLVAADQYMLDHLKQLCERELQHAIDADNVLHILDGADKANANQLRAICMHFVRNQS